MGAIDFHVVPTSGPVSGLSFEDQVTAAFNELGQEISDIETASSSAVATANEAKALAESAVNSVQAAVVAAGEATAAATQAQNAATGASAAAAEATSRANTAIDNAAQAQTAANTANGVAQGAVTAANNAQATANSAIDTASSAAQTAQIALNKINTITVAVPVGMIDLLPFRPDELPYGWFFCNGDRFAVDSEPGGALTDLSDNYKADWGITTTTGGINVPSLFYSDGRGVFMRAADGNTTLIGVMKNDTIRPITGSMTGIRIGGYSEPTPSGASVALGYMGYGLAGGPNNMLGTSFNSGNLGANFNGTESAPLAVNMTPAIYLGVQNGEEMTEEENG